MRKILTLDDLVKFCEDNNFNNFSSEESGYKLCVQVPSLYEENGDKSDDFTLYGKVKLLHTNTNRNHSNVTKKAAENCMSSIKYKPVLANFCEIDGVEDFTSHDMSVNDDGSINYIERQVGCFTADKPYMEYDEENDRYYIYATVAIPREYSHAAEIIERKEGTKVSAELYVNAMSYDAKEHELLLEDIEVMGVTLLGKNPETGNDVSEGMQGARLDIQDFSSENNSMHFSADEKLIEVLEKLNETLSNFNIDSDNTEDNTQEGGRNMFEALLEKYSKTVEDIDFDYSEMTDEELEAKFAELFEDEGDGEPNPEEEPEVDPEDDNCAEFSVTVNGETKTFSVSLGDKLNAMYSLIADTYSDLDNEWYDIEMYDDEKYVEMYGYFTGKNYRQQYKVKKDTYSLVGDRVEIYKKYMTQDEINQFEKLKIDFEELKASFEESSDKLAKYEAEPQKMEILESKDYEQIAESKEFVELKSQDVHFDMTVDEVRDAADKILLAYAKTHTLEFAQVDEVNHEVGSKTLIADTKKVGTYGRLHRR